MADIDFKDDATAPVEELLEMGTIRMTISEGSRAAVARRVASIGNGGAPQPKEPSLDTPHHPTRRNVSSSVIVARRVASATLPGPYLPVRALTKEDVAQHLDGQDSSAKYVSHQFSLGRLAEYFNTHIDVDNVSASKGHSKKDALSLLKEHGPNELTPPARVPLWLLFLLQFTNFFMLLLIFAGLLSLIFYFIDPAKDLTNLILGVLLLLVVFFTCYETYSQEAKSDELMEKFRAMVPLAATCIRDGELQQVKAEELVIGDIVCFTAGDKIPADCRIIQTKDMKVDQSMITGESDPVNVSVRSQHHDPLEAKNIVFSGSLVTDGSGMAVVIRTGDQTLIGSMVELTGETGKAQSTLKTDVEHAVFLISTIAAVQAVAAFTTGVIRGINPVTAFVQGFIVIMVANVPQGLPSTVTAQLFIVAERMGAHNVFVKKLDVIETLGSCSMICTDKTGTLTQNLMTVVNLWTPKESLTADAARQALSKCTDESNCSLRLLVAGMSLNSRVVHETKDGEMALKGDATELGIHRYCSSALSTFASDHTNLESYRAANEKIHEIPFNSSNKWQLSIHCVSEGFSSIAPAGAKQVLLLKGAPDVLMSKCSQYVDPHGQVVAIEDSFMSSYLKAYEDFGGCGERVLGFAVRFLPFTIVEEEKSNSAFLEDLKSSYTKTGEETRSDLTFVGLATLMDPARKEVPAAIADCHTAGIKVVMVTGDHPITAEAIARNIGLMHHPTKAMMSRTSGIPEDQIEESTVKAAVIHGNQIPGLSEEYWRELANKPEIVFARTSPEQKLLIVQKFTAAGNVVAMTGDGVNDSPALKQAAIGIAMGMNGSDVAREAADVVLLDDNFASIVIGVREGRLLFANLRKSITYTLSHLLPEVLPVLMWAFTGFPQTINSILILFIDLWTELAPASSLAFEKAEDNIMNVPPRNPKTDKLVDGTVMLQSYALIGVLEVGVCYLIFYMVLQQYGLEMRDFARSNDEYFTVSVDRDYTSYDGDIFSANEQKHILSVIQATWYLSIVMCQAINIWCCKSRTESIFSLSIFDNRYVNFGVTLALILGIVAVYVPGFQYITASSNPPSLIMLYGALVAIAALVGLTELQKWSIRSYPDMTHVVSIIFMTLLTAAVLIVAFLN